MRKPKSKRVGENQIFVVMVNMMILLAGWCGTVYPFLFWWWWRRRRFPIPVPPPDPEPWFKWNEYLGWTILGVASGGIGGNLLYNELLQDKIFANQEIVISVIASFAISKVITTLGSGIVSGMNNKRM